MALLCTGYSVMNKQEMGPPWGQGRRFWALEIYGVQVRELLYLGGGGGGGGEC